MSNQHNNSDVIENIPGNEELLALAARTRDEFYDDISETLVTMWKERRGGDPKKCKGQVCPQK